MFPAETPLNSTYGFPFWRISYLYDFLRRRGDEVSIGVSLQIRDATFTSADGTLRADRRDVGPVPTLKFRGRWGFESSVWWGTEIAGIDLRACASSELTHASASSAMNQNVPKPRKLLLTGATGFVGRHLDVALAETDWEVVRGTRNRKKASQPGWVYLDVADPSAIRRAIAGCDAAVYLIHSIDDSKDYPEREARAAQAFLEAAEVAGVRRIVYVGGVAPKGKLSRHLRSRLHTGEILRSGDVSTIELRCGLIIGAGGSSWMMVRDLAARLPAMLLPRWLQFSSWPVSIEDAVFAIVRALDLPLEESAWYDLPGPERMTHANFLSRVAKSMGKDPRLVGVPVITPTLSSYWIALVTRADLGLAKELVQGLQSDLEPSGAVFWDVLGDQKPTEFQTSVYQALEDEPAREHPTPKLVRRIQDRARG